MIKFIKNKTIPKDALAYITLILLALIMIGIIHKDGFLYGSTIDWISQSSVIPDYFRQKFYETGNLLPDFAQNLGAGQNIYYFSYYGLLNPIILISYLFPNLSMAAYIQSESIAIVFISVCLCYYWLRSLGFSCSISLIASICFLFAGPIIYQSHKQIMFVNYFPFLFMGLIGVDQYLRTQRKLLFVLSVFLCIMTSYFYSIGCILTLFIYFGYRYIVIKQDINIRFLLCKLLPLIKGLAIAVLMSSVLWLPTIYVILSGRSIGSSFLSTLFSSLIPSYIFTVEALLYNSYSLGLTAISVVALITVLFSRGKNERILSFILILLLIFPVFSYLLNGTLYVRSKSLIPFLPLYIIIIAIFLTKFVNAVNNSSTIKYRMKRIVVLMLFILITCVSGIISLIVNVGFYDLTSFEIKGTGITAQVQEYLNLTGDVLVSNADYSDLYSSDKTNLIQDVLQKDTSFYRINDLSNSGLTCNQVYDDRYLQTSIYSSTYNIDYNKFYFDVLYNPISIRNRLNCSSSNNIFFQNYMNVKYIVAKNNQTVPAGYHEVGQRGEYLIYENNNTMPLAFASSNSMDSYNFDQLVFPYNAESLFENIIVSIDANNNSINTTSKINKINLGNDKITIENQKNLIIKNENEHFLIEAGLNASLKIPLSIDLNKVILFLRYDISNEDNQNDLDTFITINGIKNKLSGKSAYYPNYNNSFEYIISSNKSTNQLTINFSSGKYEIFNIEAYTMPVSAIEEYISKIDQFIVDTKETADNKITGNIQVANDGYFATTLPYDKGFSITVDGIPQNYQKVNTAFVGFPIEKGYHHIVIQFNAPFKKTGIALSLIGLILFILDIIIDKKRKNISNNKI